MESALGTLTTLRVSLKATRPLSTHCGPPSDDASTASRLRKSAGTRASTGTVGKLGALRSWAAATVVMSFAARYIGLCISSSFRTRESANAPHGVRTAALTREGCGPKKQTKLFGIACEGWAYSTRGSNSVPLSQRYATETVGHVAKRALEKPSPRRGIALYERQKSPCLMGRGCHRSIVLP